MNIKNNSNIMARIIWQADDTGKVLHSLYITLRTHCGRNVKTFHEKK